MPYLATAGSYSGNRLEKLNKNLEQERRKRDSHSEYLRQQF